MAPVQPHPAYASLLATLDPDQRAIVMSWKPGDTVQVLAAAGSGKTRTLVALVARVLVEGLLAPHDIVVTTFTRKAADELVSRLKTVLPDSAVNALRLGTFHSIAIRHLARTVRRVAGRPLNFDRCLDGRNRAEGIPDVRGVWMDILGFKQSMRLAPGIAGLDVKSAYPPDYSLAVDCIRADGIRHGTREARERAERTEKTLRSFVAAWALFEKVKGLSNTWDFSDALHDHMERVEAGHDSAKLVLVDEAQDNNRVQMRIAAGLAKNGGGSVIYVGDARQAIYGWRGANPELFSGAREVLGATRSEIRFNYRSGARIIQLANLIAEGQPWNIGEASKVGRPDKPGSIEVREAGDQEEEGWMVASMIQKSVEVGRTYGDHAILVRTNSAAAYFEMGLMRAGIPVAVQGSSSFFTRRVVVDALGYLLLAEHAQEGLLARVVGAVPAHVPTRFIGAAFVAAVSNRMALSGGSTPADMVAAMRAVGDGLNARASRAGARELADLMQRLIEASTFRDRCALLDAYYQPPQTEDQAAQLAPDAVADYELVHTLCAVGAGYKTSAELHAFGEQCAGRVKVVGDDGERQKDRVTISTVHRAKGLEWPMVFVSATRTVFPHRNSVDDEVRMAEERRLFYVAVTRAEERLILTCSGVNAMNHTAGPGEFIELYKKHLEQDGNDPGPGGGQRTPAPAMADWTAQQLASRAASAPAPQALPAAVTTPAPIARLSLEAEALLQKLEDRMPMAARIAERTPVPAIGRVVSITPADFDDLLGAAGFTPAAENGQMVWRYQFADAGVRLTVYSTIPNGGDASRSVGEDSIRVTLVHDDGRTTRSLIKRPPYTARVRGWALTLVQKLLAVVERLAKHQSCVKCGGPTVLTEGPTGTFAACVAWCSRKAA